jgi:protein tyrosine/serine phosphatase
MLTLAGQHKSNQELSNFHEVNPQLYRGAQPKPGGIKRLGQLGVKTIVDLRETKGAARAEEAEARGAGLRYFNIPMREWGRPTDEQVEHVLKILRDSENQPVFVHCRLGEDRTGLVIAIYRITHDGWTSERATAEAKKYGMHPWELGMKDYIHDYGKRRENLKSRAPATATSK